MTGDSKWRQRIGLALWIALMAAIVAAGIAIAPARADSDMRSWAWGEGGAAHVATYHEGATELITVTSTDRYVLGDMFDACSGRIIPSVWPIDAAQTALAFCRNLIKVRGKDHTIDIEVVEQIATGRQAGPDAPSHQGYLVTVSETPALFDTDTEFSFHAEHATRFPLQAVHKMFQDIPDSEGETTDNAGAEDGADDVETLWTSRVLAPLVAIARRRKETMHFYRSPGQKRQLVQIGGRWIGVAMPAKPLPGEARTEPSIVPLLDFPDEGTAQQ